LRTDVKNLLRDWGKEGLIKVLDEKKPMTPGQRRSAEKLGVRKVQKLREEKSYETTKNRMVRQ